MTERRTASWQAGRRMWKVLMLAPTLEIGEAMLRGERVPLDRLDPMWVTKFGLRDSVREAA